jgi:hypothetical protein
MKNLQNIAEDLFNKIRGRFPSVTIGTDEGEVTNVPGEARFYDFEYKEAARSLGKVSISLDETSISVMYSNDFVANEDQMTQDNWYNFLKELRQFSKKRLLNFDTRNITKSNLDRRDYKFLALTRTGEDQMTESTMYGTSKSSFQDIGTARVSIKHNAPVNQESTADRTRHIGAIYVENNDGERFKYPFKHLSGARAMARHVSEGGAPYDDFGTHIVSMSEELSKLRKFKTYMGRSSVMAEGLDGYVEAVTERMVAIRKSLKGLQREGYYKETFGAFEKPMMEDVPTDVAENWIDQLTIKQFNEELSDVFPYIYKLVSEANKAKELGPEDLEEGPIDWIKDKFNQYMKGRQADFAQYERDVQMLTNILQQNGYDERRANRIGNGCLNEPRVCLYNEIRKNGLEVGDMDVEVQRIGKELNSGLTTMSGTTNEKDIESAFEELMGQFSDSDTDEGNAYAHAVKQAKMNGKKKGDKVAGPDDDEIVLASEEQKTPLGEFILSYFDYTTGQFPKGETAILTMVEKDYGEHFINPAKQFLEKINTRVSEVMGYRDEEVGENGLQRHIGIKKYGKEGFEKLQQAGRNGASEEEKGAIKDKHLSDDIMRLAGL